MFREHTKTVTIGNKKIGGLPIFLCRFDFSKIRII